MVGKRKRENESELPNKVRNVDGEIKSVEGENKSKNVEGVQGSWVEESKGLFKFVCEGPGALELQRYISVYSVGGEMMQRTPKVMTRRKQLTEYEKEQKRIEGKIEKVKDAEFIVKLDVIPQEVLGYILSFVDYAKIYRTVSKEWNLTWLLAVPQILKFIKMEQVIQFMKNNNAMLKDVNGGTSIQHLKSVILSEGRVNTLLTPSKLKKLGHELIPLVGIELRQKTRKSKLSCSLLQRLFSNGLQHLKYLSVKGCGLDMDGVRLIVSHGIQVLCIRSTWLNTLQISFDFLKEPNQLKVLRIVDMAIRNTEGIDSSNSKLKVLHLVHCQFESLEQHNSLFYSNDTMEELIIETPHILDRSNNTLIERKPLLKGLKYLNLSHVNDRNADDVSGFEAPNVKILHFTSFVFDSPSALSNMIRKFPKLQYLDLSFSNLVWYKILMELSELKFLKFLNLDRTMGASIPENHRNQPVQVCSSLKALKLTGLFPVDGVGIFLNTNFPDLEMLSLDGGQLQAFDEELKEFSKIKTLRYLSLNRVKYHENFLLLKQLEELEIDSHQASHTHVSSDWTEWNEDNKKLVKETLKLKRFSPFIDRYDFRRRLNYNFETYPRPTYIDSPNIDLSFGQRNEVYNCQLISHCNR